MIAGKYLKMILGGIGGLFICVLMFREWTIYKECEEKVSFAVDALILLTWVKQEVGSLTLRTQMVLG